MSNTKPSNLVFAPTGGLIGAVVGGILWAKYMQWTGYTAGWVAFAIGLFAGLGVLLMGRSRAISVCLISSLFAIFGILFGKYLDVRWNAIERIKTQLIDTYGLSSNQAEPIAQTNIAGLSTWELMRSQMEWGDLIFYVTAAFIAFYVVHSRVLHRYFFKSKQSKIAPQDP